MRARNLKHLCLTVFAALWVSVLSAAAPSGYVKIWEDTFESGSLNTNNWTIGLRDPGTGHIVPGAQGASLLNTGYDAYITGDDVSVSNGSLYLQNQKRSYTGTDPSGSFSYTTGWIMSMHKVYFNKGYVEFKAKFPVGDKVWPALWLIAEDLVWGPEWDMWEYFGYRDSIYDRMGMHLCYDEYPSEKWSSYWNNGFDASYTNEEWHVYGFEWTDTFARWTVDSVQVRYLANTFGNSWPDEDMYFVLNNGTKTASPDATTSWPNNVVIDYVELYKPEAEPPTVSLTLDAANIAEAGGQAEITATLSKTFTSNVTVVLAYSGSADAGDYTSSGSSIMIPAGSTTGSVTITALQDTVNELDETVLVDIDSVTNGGEHGTQQLTVTIIDDDGAVVLETWIIAGQSNAEGYGITRAPVITGLLPATTLSDIGRSDLLVTNEGVRFYQGANDYNNVSASGSMPLPPRDSWHDMWPCEGLGFDWWWTGAPELGNRSGQRFGPELAFGFDVHQHLGRTIALIKYARGSIPLSSLESTEQNGLWKDFDPSDSRANHYDKIVSTVQGAVESASSNAVLSIRGIVWMQGESDATATLSPSYEANLTEFVSEIRADVGAIVAASGGKAVFAGASSNEMDILIGSIQNDDQYSQAVIDAQNAVAAADDHVFVVDGTTGLTLMSNDDWGGAGIHYDTAGSVLLGERFAAVAITQLDGDADGDGMSDSWEIIHFGNAVASAGGSSEDQDGDGFIDLHEYLAGTDPTNDSSRLEVTGEQVGVASNEVVLSWQAVFGKTYTILTKSNLTNAVWSTNQPGITGVEPICVHTVITSGAKSFYLLKLED